jgi:hypothetical protein
MQSIRMSHQRVGRDDDRTLTVKCVRFDPFRAVPLETWGRLVQSEVHRDVLCESVFEFPIQQWYAHRVGPFVVIRIQSSFTNGLN